MAESVKKKTVKNMRIGVPKEIKNHEYRVGLTPEAVCCLTSEGHQVFVETGAGNGIGFPDTAFERAGASMLSTAAELYERANLVIKVKEPQPSEYPFLHSDLTLFSYLHLAAEHELASALVASGCTAVAYETVIDADGRLPLLAPMSAIAGRLSIQMGAWALQSTNGGKGQLLSPVQGAPAGKVTILGAGNAGQQAMQSALGLSADVCIVDLNQERLAELQHTHGARLETASPEQLHERVVESDLVIGAVLLPGAAAPKLVTRQMVSDMSPGSVLVDISIDQGGCFETSRATTHDAPVFVQEDVVHYCVTNMPAAVSRTSTLALVSATLPYVREVARLDTENGLASHSLLARGLNVTQGKIVHPAVRRALSAGNSRSNGSA